MIAFRSIGEAEVSVLHEWLNSGEALRWYAKEPSTIEALRGKYGHAHSATTHLVATLDEKPIGFVQCYLIRDYPDYCRLVAGRPGDCGLDIFLGNDADIGRGLGTRVLKAALEAIVFDRFNARRCLIGPSPDNKRAIRCFEKCGFAYVRTVTDEDGESEYLMAIERP